MGWVRCILFSFVGVASALATEEAGEEGAVAIRAYEELFLERLEETAEGRVFLLATRSSLRPRGLEEAIRKNSGDWRLVHLAPTHHLPHEHRAWERETAGMEGALHRFFDRPVGDFRDSVFWILEDGKVLGWGTNVVAPWRGVGFRPDFTEVPPGAIAIRKEFFLHEMVKLRLHEMEDPSQGPRDGPLDPEDVRRCFYGYEYRGEASGLFFLRPWDLSLYATERVEACWNEALPGGLLLSEAVKCSRAHRIADVAVRLELLLDRPREAIACSRMDPRSPSFDSRCAAFVDGIPDFALREEGN